MKSIALLFLNLFVGASVACASETPENSVQSSSSAEITLQDSTTTETKDTTQTAATVQTVDSTQVTDSSKTAQVADTTQAANAGNEVQTAEALPQDSVKQEEPPKDTSYFDFSDMLIPVTHETRLGSPYGVRDHRLHRGIDVKIIMNEPILAAYPGKVITSKYNEGGYGHYVLIQHESGLQTLYGHLSKRLVKVGDYVFPGDIVGLGGNTGRSSGAHLHFEMRYGKVNIDPGTVIDFQNWKLMDGVEHMDKKPIFQAHNRMQAILARESSYIVQKGDTKESVAKWFNISVKALCRINNLDPGAPLKVGQRLRGNQ